MKYELGQVINSIIADAKSRRVLYFTPQANEIEEEYTEPNTEHTTARREGLWCEDIDGYYSPTIKDWLKFNIEGLKEAYEKKELKYLSSYLRLGMVWSQWAWTIDSIKSVKYEIAFENYRKTKVDPDIYFDKVSDAEIDTYLSEHYVKASDCLYVGKNDPSVFVADERVVPFDMKDGWSMKKLEEIMSLWHEAMTGEKVSAKFLKGNLYI